jgi:hypothetical protein
MLNFYKNNGPKWRRLSKLMPGRTPASLKNRFNTKLKLKLLDNNDNSATNGVTSTNSVKLEDDLNAKLPLSPLDH